MSPATVFVALLCGFHVSTVLWISTRDLDLQQRDHDDRHDPRVDRASLSDQPTGSPRSEHKVPFEPLRLALGAVITVIGIGGNTGDEGGFLPIKIPGSFPNGLPAIATAAVVGSLMNVVFTWIKPNVPAGAATAR